MTGQELVGRIQQKLAAQGIQWREESRDTFKAGEPGTPVRGIATTGMATFDVLKRAAANGRNFVVTHEPTFYNDKDLAHRARGGRHLSGEAALHCGQPADRLAVSRSRACDAAGSAHRRVGPRARVDRVRLGR